MSLIPSEHYQALYHEYRLIKILHHRNKNQHRSTTWWKDFNSLKRALTKLVPMLSKPVTSAAHREKVLELAMYIRCVLAEKCFRSFNGIIALAQFISLGLTLLGMLSKVNHEIGYIEGLEDALLERKQKGTRGSSRSEDVESGDLNNLGDDVGEDVGESVVVPKVDANPSRKRSANLDEEEVVREKKVKKTKRPDRDATKGEAPKVVKGEEQKDKKKKKKKKSAMDDIFGF
jgi:ribonuclease MRP protein subunit RMP1